MAGALTVVCGLAMAAPISPPSRIDLPGPRIGPASDLPVETRLISSLEFPEVPEAVFDDALRAPYLVATEFGAVAPVDAKNKVEKVPEPPTVLTFTAAAVFAASVLVLRGRIRRRGHRPFRRKVRHVRQLMA